MRRKVDIVSRSTFAVGDRARYTAPQLSLYIIMIVNAILLRFYREIYKENLMGDFWAIPLPDFLPVPG